MRNVERLCLAHFWVAFAAFLGLGLVAIAFTFFNAFVFRVDAVRNPHELFAVQRPRSANGEHAAFTRTQSDTLVRETGGVSEAIDALVNRVIDQQFSHREENKFLEVTLRSGKRAAAQVLERLGRAAV